MRKSSFLVKLLRFAFTKRSGPCGSLLGLLLGVSELSERLQQLLGALESEVDVGADVVGTQHRVEASPVEHGLHRGIHAGEHHLDALALRHETEVREVVDARGVDKRHLTHTDDAHTGLQTLVSQGTHDLLKTVTGSKEIRTVDLVDLDALGDGEVFEVTQLEVAVFLLGVDLLRDDLHVGGLSHTAHEEQTSAEQAYLNGDGKVEDDGEQEGYPKHYDVALGVLQDAEERTPTAHVVADNDKHACKTSHRDILC